MSASKIDPEATLLGGFPFVSRTFKGRFKENPYVLDTDANLYIGPADQIARDEHVAVAIVYQFLNQTDRPLPNLQALLRNREALLEAFDLFDSARERQFNDDFRIQVFGTYDGDPLVPVVDDEFPAGPCGRSVNELKRRFYGLCLRLDASFHERRLSERLQEVESRFLIRSPAFEGLGEDWTIG